MKEYTEANVQERIWIFVQSAAFDLIRNGKTYSTEKHPRVTFFVCILINSFAENRRFSNKNNRLSRPGTKQHNTHFMHLHTAWK